METLNTIATNWNTLSNAPIDWSMTGGMIWLTSYLVVMAIGFAWFMIADTRRHQEEARLLRRAEAQKVASRRQHLMETQGYVDTRSF